MFCQDCRERDECKKICKWLKKYLNRREIRGYSIQHIRRKETLVKPSVIEWLAEMRAFKIKFNWVPKHPKWRPKIQEEKE